MITLSTLATLIGIIGGLYTVTPKGLRTLRQVLAWALKPELDVLRHCIGRAHERITTLEETAIVDERPYPTVEDDQNIES